MGFDKKYLLWALGYIALGMVLGLVMASSHDHAQHVTHAHTLLVGFVVSFIYAVIHKLWLSGQAGWLPSVQFIAHQAGTLAMISGLFLLYGGIVPPEQIEPVLALSSMVVFVAALLMIVMTLRQRPLTA